MMITEEQHIILCDYCKIRNAQGILNLTGDPCCLECCVEFLLEHKSPTIKLVEVPFQT